MTSEHTEDVPSLPWRIGSSIVMGLAGTISRTFLLAGQRLEVTGLDEFLILLDERKDVDRRKRGLITASNHLSILDDPLMWGSLPYRYQWTPNNHRWGLGSHDLMFKQRALCTFFSLGQVLPAHRLAHSPDGGPFQPTITQAIRILSAARPRPGPPTEPTTPTSQLEIDTRTHPEYSIPDPFTSGSSPYYYSAPSDPYAYQNPTYHSSYNNKAWVHIFPEGRIHQHPERLMRYHKWGIGRLILESDPAPLFVPIWIEGFENIMHESRQFPRFVPRVLKDVSVTFGKGTGTDEGAFKELRARWRSLVEHERTAVEHDFTQSMSRQSLGSRATDKVHEDELVEFDREEALAERLRNSAEAVHLREECTLRVREEVLKLRQARGWPDEDPKARLVDTWKAEGKLTKREGQMEDGSWIRDT